MAFPTDLTNAVDNVTDIIAAHLNNLEAKVGVNASAVVSSLDYLVKNAASVDPGHKHTSQYGEIYFYTASGAISADVGIHTTLLYHGLALDISEGLCSGFTGIDGQTNPIASVAENSAGVSMAITTTGNHNLTAGHCVTHAGFTTKTAYRGKKVVQEVLSPTVYVVLGTYTGTDTGFMDRGCGLLAGAGSAGVYKLNWSVTGDSDENTTQIKVEANNGASGLSNTAAEMHIVTKNLDANMSGTGLVTIAVGDYIWLTIANLTDATDINIRHMNLNLVKS